jgi:hypothetical protein
VLFLLVAIVARPSSQARPVDPRGGKLLERTLAIVGGQVVTWREVQVADVLRLIDASADTSAPGESRGASLLVDRLLVLNEVQRYAPPEPGEAEIEAVVDRIRAMQLPLDLETFLETAGFSESWLRGWIRDDLRIAAYLRQRFAAVGTPSDDEVAAYYASHRDEFARTQATLEAATPAIRERLAAERRDELIADWTADLRRRAKVVELWNKQPG